MKTATFLVGRCRQGMRRAAVAFVMWCLSGAAFAGETITFFHNDVAGSPAVATDVNGIQAWKETYRPYGDQLIDSSAAQNNKLWFTGKSFDDSTGLSYMGARYYDPTLGRFMAVDPVSFDLANLHSFNRYAYANNNPYKYVDPDGEFAIPVAIRGGMLLLAAGCAVVESCRNSFANADWRPLITPIQQPWVWSEESVPWQTVTTTNDDPASTGSSTTESLPTDQATLDGPMEATADEERVGEQRERRRERRERESRQGPNGATDAAGNPQKPSGEGFRDRANAKKGSSGARPSGPNRKNERERNVGIEEEHSRRPKGGFRER